MKNDNDYISAITSEPVRIMGINLRPLSIGSYLLMKKYEVAFVSDTPAETTINDLVMGIAICARTFDGFMEFINGPDCMKWVEKWGKAVNKELKRKPNYFVEKQDMFVDYLTNGMRIPKYWLVFQLFGP